MDDETLLRYSRHLLLPEWTETHQQHLASAKVLVLGMGGLGSAAAPYLASSGIGHLVLADFDTVSLDNLQRQVIYRAHDIGQLKTEAAAASLKALNSTLHIEAHTERWDESELKKHIGQMDLVLDCTDNFATRYAVNRHCHAQGVPLVSGAAVEWEARLAVFDFRHPSSPCYHCVFPEGEDILERRCATTGIFAPLVGVIGALQAAEALKCLTGIGEPMVGKLLSIQARTNAWRFSHFISDPECPVCGKIKNHAVPG